MSANPLTQALTGALPKNGAESDFSASTKFQDAFQQYLEIISRDLIDFISARKGRQDLLSAFCEMSYQKRGGMKCEGCRAPVRHVMQVDSVDDDGRVIEFAAMCRRCLEAEKVHSRRVIVSVSGVTFDEFVNHGELFPRTEAQCAAIEAKAANKRPQKTA